jgi:hypothetical protein
MVCIDDDKNFRYQESTKFVLRLDAVEIAHRVCKYEQAMLGYRVTLIRVLPAAQSDPRPYAPSPPSHRSPLPQTHPRRPSPSYARSNRTGSARALYHANRTVHSMVCIDDDDKNFRYQELTKFVLDAIEVVEPHANYEQAMLG